MARALIIGAGAIGRGFLPWLLDNFQIDVFDKSKHLIVSLEKKGGFHSFMSFGTHLKKKWITIHNATSSISDLDFISYSVVFISVGPRNIQSLPDSIGEFLCPIFSLENDPVTVDQIKQKYGLQNVYFGVPDVITSSTASRANLKLDHLSLHTEQGVLYLEKPKKSFKELTRLLPQVNWLSIGQLKKEWDAKLYIHNTPHCVAAYLGSLIGSEYLHESLSNSVVKKIIEGLIDEILTALKISTPYDHEFLEDYAKKEVERFSNKLLYDPIARVAREPIRKLDPSGRLMGALRLLLLNGIKPTYLMIGITAALLYSSVKDSDARQIKLVKHFGIKAFLKFHLAIEPNSIESEFVVKNFQSARNYLKREFS